MSDATHPEPQQVRALVDRGFELHEGGDLDACLALYEELLAAPPTGEDPVTVESLFAARFDRAVVLTELGELERAAEAYREAAERLPADDPEVSHEIAMALVNRGICLGLLGDAETALATYDDVVSRFSGPTDPVTREQVTKAMVNRAATFEELGRWEDAMTAATDVLGHLQDGEDPWADEQRAMALRSRAVALRALGRAEEAAAIYQEVVRCCDGPDATAPVRAQVASALTEHAELLVEQGRLSDAVALLADVDERFGRDPDPIVVDVLTHALRERAALVGAAGDDDTAAELLTRAAELDGL